VLQWAADMAVGWKGCTKKLSAVSYQLSAFSWIKGPARESGAFLFVPKLTWGRPPSAVQPSKSRQSLMAR
jgi:hypothetical protein